MTKFVISSACSNSLLKYFQKQISCLPELLKRNVHSQDESKASLYSKYASEIEVAVNKQIQMEQRAAQDYLNIAVKFLHPDHLRPGAGGFFMRMYEEEIRHMQQFILYQLRRGGKPVISSLKEPAEMAQFSLLDAFQRALDMEKSVTKSLESLVAIAENVKDYQCADYVISKYLSDQTSSIDELAQHIVSLCRISDSEHALYHYDLQLAKRYPYKYPTL